ncbi:MAG: glycosyltransferase family 2 protein, partial [Limisphaerales bacterium]
MTNFTDSAGTIPLVSIIIPCFNAEKWIETAIQSALDQTWPNKEVIVIDDGSSDLSLSVINKFDGKVVLKSGPHKGGCAARNLGVE